MALLINCLVSHELEASWMMPCRLRISRSLSSKVGGGLSPKLTAYFSPITIQAFCKNLSRFFYRRPVWNFVLIDKVLNMYQESHILCHKMVLFLHFSTCVICKRYI